jgi:heme exporter protein D
MILQEWLARLDQNLYFRSVHSLLDMDGHGAFVWSAYLITAVVLVAIVLVPVRRKRRFLSRLTGELKRREGSPTAMKEGN